MLQTIVSLFHVLFSEYFLTDCLYSDLSAVMTDATMATCKKCEVAVGKTKEVTCGKCDSVYHHKCVTFDNDGERKIIYPSKSAT